jgi:hypothetical protein
MMKVASLHVGFIIPVGGTAMEKCHIVQQLDISLLKLHRHRNLLGLKLQFFQCIGLCLGQCWAGIASLIGLVSSEQSPRVLEKEVATVVEKERPFNVRRICTKTTTNVRGPQMLVWSQFPAYLSNAHFSAKVRMMSGLVEASSLYILSILAR